MNNSDRYNDYLTDKSQIIDLVGNIYKRTDKEAYDEGYSKGYDAGKDAYSERLNMCQTRLSISEQEKHKFEHELEKKAELILKMQSEINRARESFPVAIGDLLYSSDRKHRKVAAYVCTGYHRCPTTGENLIRVMRYQSISFPKSIPVRVIGTHWFLTKLDAEIECREG